MAPGRDEGCVVQRARATLTTPACVDTCLPTANAREVARRLGWKRTEIVIDQEGAAGEEQENRVPHREQSTDELLPNPE